MFKFTQNQVSVVLFGPVTAGPAVVPGRPGEAGALNAPRLGPMTGGSQTWNFRRHRDPKASKPFMINCLAVSETLLIFVPQNLAIYSFNSRLAETLSLAGVTELP